MSFVVLYRISSHLQRTVDHHKLTQLLGQCGMRMRTFYNFREVEDSGREVGRSSKSTCERQCNGVGRRITASTIPGVILLSTDPFLCHQVGPCTLDASRHGRLVVVDHDVMLGSTLYHTTVMTDAILRFCQFLAVEIMAYITGLHGTDAQFLKPAECLFHLVLKQGGVTPCLSMADKAHTFRLSVATHFLYIEIRIRLQIADLLTLSPSWIPTFSQHPAEAMTGGKVHIAFHVFCRGTMRGSHLPGVLLLVDAPPDTDVSAWLYP